MGNLLYYDNEPSCGLRTILEALQKVYITNLLNDDIPRVVGARAAHYGGEDRVRSVHGTSALTQSPDHRVVSRCHLQHFV